MKKWVIKKSLIYAAASCMVPILFSFSACRNTHITVQKSSVQFNINGEAEFYFRMHGSIQGGAFSEVTIQQNTEDEDKKLKISQYPSFIDTSNFLLKIAFNGQKKPVESIDIHFNLIFNWYDNSGNYITQVITGLIAKYNPQIIPPTEKIKNFQTELVDDKYITSGYFNDFTIHTQSIPLLDLQPHATCEDEQIHGNVYADISGNANKFNLHISILTDEKIDVGLYPLVIWIQINEETIYWSKDEFSFRIVG